MEPPGLNFFPDRAVYSGGNSVNVGQNLLLMCYLCSHLYIRPLRLLYRYKYISVKRLYVVTKCITEVKGEAVSIFHILGMRSLEALDTSW